MIVKEIFNGVFKIDEKISTKNLTPGYKFFDEEIIRIDESEFRVWNPYRSKLAAAIKKGLKNFLIKEGMKILYLGIASGKTASHISDIIKNEGMIFGVDKSKRSMKDLLFLAKIRKNIFPILENAKFPKNYSFIKEIGKIDLVYCDISDKKEVEIFIKNMEFFEVKYGMIAIKAKSIDSRLAPIEVFEKSKQKLEKVGIKIVEEIDLEPYEIAHSFFVVEW